MPGLELLNAIAGLMNKAPQKAQVPEEEEMAPQLETTVRPPLPGNPLLGQAGRPTYTGPTEAMPLDQTIGQRIGFK